jgi:two-component system OmpR family response regulator
VVARPIAGSRRGDQTLTVRVLIVDDAALVRARLGAMLAEIPGVGVVVEADTYALAVEVLCAWAPDVVIVDLHLGAVSGLGLVSIAKRDHPRALLIVMTSHPTSRHRRRCLALGADHFLDKSQDFENVVRIVSEATGPTALAGTSDE